MITLSIHVLVEESSDVFFCWHDMCTCF